MIALKGRRRFRILSFWDLSSLLFYLHQSSVLELFHMAWFHLWKEFYGLFYLTFSSQTAQRSIFRIALKIYKGRFWRTLQTYYTLNMFHKGYLCIWAGSSFWCPLRGVRTLDCIHLKLYLISMSITDLCDNFKRKFHSLLLAGFEFGLRKTFQFCSSCVLLMKDRRLAGWGCL